MNPSDCPTRMRQFFAENDAREAIAASGQNDLIYELCGECGYWHLARRDPVGDFHPFGPPARPNVVPLRPA